MSRWKGILTWAIVSALAGVLIASLAGIYFWIATATAALALTINGIVAFREDKGTFND